MKINNVKSPNIKITGKATGTRGTGKLVNEDLTLGADLPVTQLVRMIECICSFYSGYPNVVDEYKESCPDCPLNFWYCDKLSTLTNEFLREVMTEYPKILMLKEKYHIHNVREAELVEKEFTGKK